MTDTATRGPKNPRTFLGADVRSRTCREEMGFSTLFPRCLGPVLLRFLMLIPGPLTPATTRAACSWPSSASLRTLGNAEAGVHTWGYVRTCGCVVLLCAVRLCRFHLIPRDDVSENWASLVLRASAGAAGQGSQSPR